VIDLVALFEGQETFSNIRKVENVAELGIFKVEKFVGLSS
jgi:hypothetical protein